MIKNNRKYDYLLCIDSDGTVMDTMTIKHLNCFGPCFIEVFGITEHTKDILDHWNHTNLYSMDRGINRFQGLKEILEYVDLKYGYKFDGVSVFYNWVINTKAFSVDLLKEESNKYPNNDVLKKAISWSNLVNERIRLLPPSLTFENTKEALEVYSNCVDLLGVSSANLDAVLEEWNRLDVSKYFMDILCQDSGSKESIIREALTLGYEKDHVIMLGDAIGDLKAAKKNGVLFFPIIPLKEKECWQELIDIKDSILLNKYKDLEDHYINKFEKFLKGDN